MKLNFHFFNPATEASDIVIIPYTWLLIKNYFDNKTDPETKSVWNWPEPICDSFDEDFVMQELEKNPPHVFGVSCYVWNESLCHSIAQKVKIRWPNCIVILGGPQQDSSYNNTFFHRHPYIDAICKPEGYGEVFVTKLLEMVAKKDVDFSKIPFSIYPAESLYAIRNEESFRFKEFIWQSGMFSENRDYLERRIAYAKSKDKSIYTAYETSRGCPYKCSFCEWGGAGSKVTFKTTASVIDDLESMAALGIEYVEIVDANFGIVERDVEIADKLVQLKADLNLPVSIGFSGMSKNNKKFVNVIHEKTVAAGLLPEIKISVQDFDQAVLPHINRIDKPWQEQLLAARKIAEKYPVDIRFDMILGLPGSTIESFKESLHIEYSENVDTIRYIWFLLKDTPAYNPAYQAKNKIETAEINMLKVGVGNKKINYYTVNSPPPFQSHTVVVKTFSYDQNDWVEMHMLNHLKEAGRKTQLLQPIFSYEAKKGTHVGEMAYSLFKNVMLNSQYGFSRWFIWAKSEIERSLKEKGNVEFIKTPFNSPFVIQLTSYFVLTITFYKDEFYRAIDTWLNSVYGEDPKRSDLIEFIRQSVITAEMDIHSHTIYTNYNWPNWINKDYKTEIVSQPAELKSKTATYGPFADTLFFNFSEPMQKISYSIKSLTYITHSHLITELTPASNAKSLLAVPDQHNRQEWQTALSEAGALALKQDVVKANEIIKGITSDQIFQNYLNQNIPILFKSRFAQYSQKFTFEIYRDLGRSKTEPPFTCCNNIDRFISTVKTVDDVVSQFLHVICHEVCAELWTKIDLRKDQFDLVTRDFLEEIFGVFLAKLFYPQFSNHFYDYCLKFATYLGIEKSYEFTRSFSVFSENFFPEDSELKSIYEIYKQPQDIFDPNKFKLFIESYIAFSESHIYKDYITIRFKIDSAHKKLFQEEYEKANRTTISL